MNLLFLLVPFSMFLCSSTVRLPDIPFAEGSDLGDGGGGVALGLSQAHWVFVKAAGTLPWAHHFPLVPQCPGLAWKRVLPGKSSNLSGMHQHGGFLLKLPVRGMRVGRGPGEMIQLLKHRLFFQGRVSIPSTLVVANTHQ